MEKSILNDSLGNMRVLDFTGELGPYAARMYAGLGADVIHIEPMGGDPLRKRGPFLKNIPGSERGFQYLYYNAGKRGMVLDITKAGGREVFVKLCASADILLESFRPGYLEGLGLSYDELSAFNPRLVQASITPFGNTGKYAGFLGTDLTCSALGGFLFLGGVDNDKPVRASDNQAYRMAESYAAVGSAVAAYFAMKTGVGQFVDVSCMEGVGMALENAAQYWDLEGKIRRGRGKEAGSASIHPCKDGYLAIVAVMGRNKGMWVPFVEWMKSEKVDEWEVFDDDKWIDPAYRSSDEGYETFCRIFEKYTMQHTKLALYDIGQAFKVAISPVSNGKDLLENPQLKYQNFWKVMKHESLEGEEITYPGTPYEFGHLNWRLGNPAPVYGEHTIEILQELGYSRSRINELAKEEVIYVRD
jgi:benzylsuccinate CoA-transferase BbsE subunit